MTISTLSMVLDRIKHAKPESPIALFYVDKDKVDSMFASTIATQKIIKAKPDNLIGVYDETHDLDKVRSKIKAHQFMERITR